jgi:hypothetical protein
MYEIDYEMEWYDRSDLYNLVIGEEVNKQEFSTKATNLITELIILLQDISILVYNVAKVNSFLKYCGNTFFDLDADGIDDDLMELDKNEIENIMKNKFKRINKIEFNREPNIWKIEIEENFSERN